MHGSVCSMPSIEVWRVHDATNKPQRAVPSCWKEALGERTPNKARRSLARLMRCFDFWLNWVTYGCFLFNAVGDHFGFKLRKKKKKKLIRFHTLSTAYNHNTIMIISTNPRNPMLAAHWHPKPSFSQHQSWRNGFLLLPKLSLPLKQMDHGKFQPSNLTLSH